MMIAGGDADVAETAVLGTGWLGKVASATDDVGAEENMVVRVIL